MTDDDLARVNARLTQLMGQNVAQGFMLDRVLGLLALASPDWREALDDVRMTAEWSIKNLEWVGSAPEGDAVRADAMTYLETSLDALHKALLTAGPHAPPPAPNANPSSS